MENNKKILDAHIVLSTRDDKTSKTYLNRVQAKKLNPLLHLIFEEYGKKWNYYCKDGYLYFVIGKNIYKAISVYNRGCSTESQNNGLKYIHAIIEGANVMKVSGCGFVNGSKLMQGSHTILHSIKMRNSKTVKYPDTVIVKGPLRMMERVQNKIKNYIVKSISYIRSNVVDKNEIDQWDHYDAFYVPTQFQKAIYGINIRNHYVNGKNYPVEIRNNNRLDYRYSTEPIEYRKHALRKDICEFIEEVTLKEQNQIMGIDFIASGNDYYCLEANPTPGWCFFEVYTQAIATQIWKYQNEKNI